MRNLSHNPHGYRSPRRRRFSLLMLTGMFVPLVLAIVATSVFLLPRLGLSHAATANVNGDCTLIIPAHPLTAQGLATPYQLTATDPAKGPCNESNPAQGAFVQAAVIDPATGKIGIYNPLVIDKGTKPAMPPVVPTIPQGAAVGIWIGFNGNNLTQQGTDGSLQEGNCINGVPGSIFGQVSYCDAPAFFQAANAAISTGKLVPPTLGKASDGLPCPTVRDFAVVDQDQSDNVTTTYLANTNGQTAQMTPKNMAAMKNAQTLANGSDNHLLVAVDTAIGCKPWTAPDLADPGQMLTAQPLNELQAAASQTDPIALVPSGDPMVLANNGQHLNKLNAYRMGVDQPTAQSLNAASTRTYCENLLAIAPQRLQLDASFTKVQPPLDPAAANSLFTFLAQRFVFTYEKNGLNCQKLLGKPDPVHVKTNEAGVAIDATINGTTTSTPVNCSVNGTMLAGCTGETTINGQTCSFAFDGNAQQVDITCPAKGQK